MDYARLGNSNLVVSRLGLGAMGFGDTSWRGWVLEADTAAPIVRRALDRGVNFFDTCDFYSAGRSEEILREVLVSQVPRDSIVLATKVGNPMQRHPNGRGYSRKHIIEAADASLRRLGTDHIDLYQTHIWDPATNIEELVEAFDTLVRAGKVLYVGATTMPAWQFGKALWHAAATGQHRFVAMQCEYNPAHREAEREMIPLCRDAGIGLVPFSPMARGYLCGDRRDPAQATLRNRTDDYTHKIYGRENDHEVRTALEAVADARGVSAAQVAVAWTLARPGITSPIFGATSVAQLDQVLDALDLALEPDEIGQIDAAYAPRPIHASGH